MEFLFPSIVAHCQHFSERVFIERQQTEILASEIIWKCQWAKTGKTGKKEGGKTGKQAAGRRRQQMQMQMQQEQQPCRTKCSTKSNNVRCLSL